MKRLIIGLAALCLAAPCFVVSARAETEAPKPGGTLNVGTNFITLSAMSWDPADWPWKLNHDAGNYLESLFVGDLSKSTRNGGKYSFRSDAYLPPDVIRGELARDWHWEENPLRMVINLREGVLFPDKEGVMKSRELVPDDVVFSFNYFAKSPKTPPRYYEYIEKVEASGPRQVTFFFKNYHSEWDYRFGWGYNSTILPHEMAEAGAKDWKNAVGTGPFQIAEHTPGNTAVYAKNPIYWDHETINGTDFKLPFVDKVVYYTIKDEASWIAALRTGKLDILEAIRWQNIDSLKQSVPQLKWARSLSVFGQYLSLRTDQKPFDDIRVRRALNMAVNKQEIVSSYYNGHAEVFGYPQHPTFEGYWEPLEAMPDSVKELFAYNPAKAKQLLTEAGYPNGFSFKVEVCACNPDQMDLLPLIAAYLEQVGVKVEIQPMEYGAFYSAMMTKTHTAGYLMGKGVINPTRTLSNSFGTGEPWNVSMLSDSALDAKFADMYTIRDEAARQDMVKAMTREILGKAPYIWLPTGYSYTAWWPWVKNYDGELRAAAVKPGPIYARLWIDQDMKKQMGH
jgi:peptide/nickel transport system substrate-binding protein